MVLLDYLDLFLQLPYHAFITNNGLLLGDDLWCFRLDFIGGTFIPDVVFRNDVLSFHHQQRLIVSNRLPMVSGFLTRITFLLQRQRVPVKLTFNLRLLSKLTFLLLSLYVFKYRLHGLQRGNNPWLGIQFSNPTWE